MYIVTSKSMVPNLNIGDLLIIKEQQHNNTLNSYSFSNLKVGDIIIFKTPCVNVTGRHETVVHRVAEIKGDDQANRIIRTKGDANPASVPLLDYPIRESNYIGKVVYVIPKVGLITQVLRPPINYIVIGGIIITMVYYLRKELRIENKKPLQRK
jgi:signal peptidase I